MPRRPHQAARSYRTLTPLDNQAGSSWVSPDSIVAPSSLPKPSRSCASLVFCAALFLFRLPLFIIAFSAYFLVTQWVHLGSIGNKLCLWTLMAILGVWWTDLQIDRVKPGSLAQQPLWRLPRPGSIMVVSATYPIDAIFLAAVFDPIFTVLYPRSRLVQELSLLQAIFRVGTNETSPSSHANLTDLKTVLKRHPDRIIAVLTEYSATNGTGTVPSTLGLSDAVKIFCISIQYLPADVSTPAPGTYLALMWTLLSRPMRRIRLRIADGLSKDSSSGVSDKPKHPRNISKGLTHLPHSLHGGRNPSRSSFPEHLI
ncbi:hypothetical protein B0T10DRAFT_411144 [Thelonectria olida]|uniref:Uncharacterized protein n=1 Tax=Thelonectria olida TaxID=1576542 RepID=A0A9P9ALP3_9HYPO|nr:hypothetical protein B0T10DRAFT_411144 [Thelonectria olida]